MNDDGNGTEGPVLERFKEFRITSLAIDHRTSVMVLFAILVFGGITSYIALPKESFPEAEIPMIAVSTIYPGVSPADMETLVTRPLEEELNTISDVKELTSTSVEGYSSIVAEFEATVNLDEALASVREKVDLAKPELPADVDEPTIIEFNFSEVPVMQVNLSGEYGLVRLKELSEDIKDELEQLPQILRADVRGGLEREVKVDVDLRKIQFYNIGFQDVIDAIAFENVNIPGGSIDVGSQKYLVRVDGEFDDPTIIEDLVVTTKAGRPIYVRDIATVEFGFAERESYARLDGAPVVTIDVIKRSGQNIIETSAAVKEVVAGMEPLFPPTTVVKFTSDSSEDIFEMVASLENNIVSGLLLIIGVLLFFLGLRTSIFVAISIPASMLLSFIIIRLAGVTLNMVVLFSLILALGMLVDNAIVIVENIYRYLEEGWDRIDAAKKATGEVAMPVIVATATTLAAFAPLLFWPGMMGQFMGYLPLTLIITLSSSLFVAIVIIPVFCAMYMRLEDEPRAPMTREARITGLVVGTLALAWIALQNPLTAVLLLGTALGLYFLHTRALNQIAQSFQATSLPKLTSRYEDALRWSLNHRGRIIATAAGTFVGSIALFMVFNNGSELFPEDIPPAQVFVDVEAPVGTRAGFTNDLARALEGQIGSVDGMDDSKSIVTTVGGGGGGGANMMGSAGPSGPNAGRLTVSFVDYKEQQADVFETLANLQATMGADLAGAEVSVEKMAEGPPTGPPINIEISGEDPVVLEELAASALQVLRSSAVFPKLVGLDTDVDDARPELSIVVDREMAGLYGLTTFKVANAVRGAVQGIEAAKYRTGNDEYDIIVRLAPEFRAELSDLDNLTVMAEGQQIPITSVASWQVGEGLGSIKRKDMFRVATIGAEVVAGENSNAVLGEVQSIMADFGTTLPPGYAISYTGEQEEQAEAMSFLGSAFLIALALIAFILVSQFNSVVKPVIILSSVFMSTVGVLLGLIIFQMPFGIIMTGVGIISLAGIVVNNAIVLIDYIDILRERDGMDRREALVQGGRTRFRPVLLTAITTALGLVPLAIGLNFDFFGLYTSLSPELYWGGEQAAWWGPMAIAVIAGILFATVLTLFLVPVMYSLVDDATAFLKRHYTADAAAESEHDDTGRREAAPVGEREVLDPVPALARNLESGLEPA